MKTKLLSLSLLLVGVASYSPIANGETKEASVKPACRDFIKECFAYGNEERASCYYESASHSACAGSEISDLLMKRWSLTPPEAAPDMKGLNFTGNQLANPECIERFDSKLSAWVVSVGETQAKAPSLAELNKFLETCETKDNKSLSFQ